MTEKWETVRRLRYGALVKLFRHRWGYELPDDDAGRGDLWELVTNVSLAVGSPEKKMKFVIETWAPWMDAKEAAMMIEHVNRLTIYERTPTAKELGGRLGLTNAERNHLKLWPVKPIDATDEEIAAQRKARQNERRRMKRGRTRGEYLASCLSQQRPWESEGVCRRTWERGRVASPAPTIVSKAVPRVATASVVESQKGFQRGAEVTSLSQTRNVRDEERLASGSSRLRHNLRQEGEKNPQVVQLIKWGRRKPWSKRTILSDEARDLNEFPLHRDERRAS